MGLRELDSGAPPFLGARLGANTPVWDEPHGMLRDWDLFRGFAAGGLGVTHQHVGFVVAMAVFWCASLLAAVACALLCVCKACVRPLRALLCATRRASPSEPARAAFMHKYNGILHPVE